jgi:Fe-S cluster biogenesis protein NfuA
MKATMDNTEFQTRTEEIERLVQRVTDLPDGEARSTALELLQAVMDLHGSVVNRIVEVLSESEAGRTSLSKLGSDPLICGLLVLYGVHPVSLEERVGRAIEKVRPQLHKHGGSVELLQISDGVVRLSIQSSGQGCHSSPEALKQTLDQAIREAAPEVVEIIAEGLASGFVPITMIQSANHEEKEYEKSAA